MTIPAPENCPHETRPGTVVCLHCRHDARMAVRAERQRKIGRIFVALVIVGVIGAAVSAGAAAMQSRWDWKEVLPTLAANFGSSSTRPAAAELLASHDEPAASAQSSSATSAAPASSDSATADSLVGSVAADSAVTDSSTIAAADPDSAAAPTGEPQAGMTPAALSVATSAPAVPTSPAPAPAAAPAIPRLTPAIAEGRTELGDSVFALREGSIVTVHFDTPMGRTRRRDKFESMVRRTLPVVYGPAADSALSALPVGSLTGAGDLLAELPSSGIRLALSNGATLSIWPRTRPGRDGPLVVAYRAIVSR